MWGFWPRSGLRTPWFALWWGWDVCRCTDFHLELNIAPRRDRVHGFIACSAWIGASWNWPWTEDHYGPAFFFYAGENLPEPEERS